jgi:2-keto-4-pentenoate hydratase/2-oxohepta-3-ene-1,7-dioic acid hydratase in catechol pathway
MKIGRVDGGNGRERLGVLVESGGGQRVLDLAAASAAMGQNQPAFQTMEQFIAGGRAALDAAYGVIEHARKDGGAAWLGDPEQVKWLIPVQPRNCVCAGRNFGRHRDASKSFWSKEDTVVGTAPFPTGFIKLVSNLVPQYSVVAQPEDVTQFDYEIEIAAVIARPTTRIGEKEALGAVFGYTIFNDLSAREWQVREMKQQTIMLGKNFPGFGPVGPWILTADEVPDPQQLGLELRVNGEVRQRETCADMVFSFAQLIAFWSRMGFQAGDLVTTGTPDGVALHHKPDPSEWYLRPGDRVECIVPQIGTLVTTIR